jgi:hypothetical protein
MIKKKEINITIPRPCKKKEWDDMTPNTQGRHCDNCNFTVIDFTNFTDRELVDFLLKSKEHLCGRFTNFQINRPMAIHNTQNNSLFSKTFLSVAILTGIGNNINAQSTIQNTVAPVQTSISSSAVNTSNQNNAQQEKQIKPNNQCLKGMVTDKRTKQPINNASVKITGTSIITYTDSTGAFSLPLPDSLSGKKIILRFHKFRHRIKNYTVKASNQSDFIKIVLLYKKEEVVWMGCPSF